MTQMDRPLLALTLGDPAGIGPEVVAQALRHDEVYEWCRPLVVGDRRILERAQRWIGPRELQVAVVDDPAVGDYRPGTLTMLDLANAVPAACPRERSAQPRGGRRWNTSSGPATWRCLGTSTPW